MKRPLWLLVAAGGLIMSAGLGIRQTFGLFVGPFAQQRNLSLGVVAFAIALQNLIWGLAQPFAGNLADTYGARAVVAAGAVLYAAGLALAAFVPSSVALILGLGILVGLGLSCMTFAVVIAAVSRTVEPEKRANAVALAAAAGSVGQVILIPVAQASLATGGIITALLLLAAIALLVAPSGTIFAGTHPSATKPMKFGAAVALAVKDPGYLFLTAGFFTCGFQLAFIGVHLPNYLRICGLPSSVGATALALIGAFNILGTWGCGKLAARYPPHLVLAALYTIRGIAISAFALTTPTPASTAIFAILMGVAWLGTVPPTNAAIARSFGTANLGGLFGVCFLSHQVGSFLGAWMGGVIYDATGSYALMWGLQATMGFVAAALNLPIRYRPQSPVTA